MDHGLRREGRIVADHRLRRDGRIVVDHGLRRDGRINLLLLDSKGVGLLLLDSQLQCQPRLLVVDHRSRCCIGSRHHKGFRLHGGGGAEPPGAGVPTHSPRHRGASGLLACRGMVLLFEPFEPESLDAPHTPIGVAAYLDLAHLWGIDQTSRNDTTPSSRRVDQVVRTPVVRPSGPLG